MVCPVARGKMAVLARCIMGDGRLQSRTADKVGNKKLLAQDIYREFCEADEPNLLNEEDMHIFGLKPLTDELHLVSCNACNKPIMASQYLAHAEICKLLGSSFKATLESDGQKRNKKPHCKERKKSLRSTSRKPGGVDNGHIVKGPHAVPQNGGYSTCSMPPPMKLPRIAGHHPSERDGSRMISGSMKTVLCDISPSNQEMLCDYPMGKSKSTEVNTKGQFSAGSPAPLASKIYYSQRSSRLRFVLAESHYAVPTEGLSSCLDPREQCTIIPTDPDPFLGRGSELYPGTTLGCVQTPNGSNHLSDTALRPEDFPFPLVGNNLSPKLHSFAGESGKSLPAQQPNGTVPIT